MSYREEIDRLLQMPAYGLAHEQKADLYANKKGCTNKKKAAPARVLPLHVMDGVVFPSMLWAGA